MAGWGMGALCAGQPPAEEKRSAERRGQDRSQGVPLDKLPVPENGLIVVTPDLKKALDALGAGSVVLSAERYLELMSKADKAKPDKPSSEILFSKCLITGEVNQVAGRELAELTFELEFRTETPNAMVPIPFKGIRISSATLNGLPPIWGPDPEKWSLLIREPQVCKLKLSTSVPITRLGQEKRLSLERVPASAITSLDLTVPGIIPSAMVLGYGSINVLPVDKTKTRLTAPALGVLSALELTWQTGEAGSFATPASVEGDIRLTIEESQALVEARFKLMPFTPIQLPWKVRLPKNIQQVRAELARNETGGGESLVVTRQNDGTYVLTTPYAVNMTQFTQVVIRWRQALPETDSADPVLLGSCELIEPVGKLQTGVLQAVIPEEAAAFLKPMKLIVADRNFLQSDRENRRNPRFRYTQQPAGLEAVSLPRSLTRGMVEARMQHTLGVQEGSWFLSTDIEIVRTARTNLAQVELKWPADWQVSRKLLFSPAVKEIEQDAKNERLRIILDGRQPASFTLKLESVLASSQNQVILRLPQLVSAQGMHNDRLTPLDIIIQAERLRLESRGWDLQVAPGMTGLRDEGGETTQRAEASSFLITGHPAQLTLLRQPRLPKWSSKVETYVGMESLQTRQTIQLRSVGSLPRRLTMQVPRSVKTVQFVRIAGDNITTELLHSSILSGDDSNPGKQYQVDLPLTTEKSISVLCVCEQEARHPITLPFVRLDESVALFEGTATVQCFYEAGLKLSLPAELPGWKVEKQDTGTIQLQGDSLLPLLVLDRAEVASEPNLQRIKKISNRIEQDGSSYLVEQEAEFGELHQTTIRLDVTADRQAMTLLGWRLDDRMMPVGAVQWIETPGITSLTFTLPPEKLFSPVKVTVALRLKREGMSFLGQVPGLHWTVGSKEEIIPETWRIKSDPSAWLWWANEHADEGRQASYGWLPTAPVQQEGSGSVTVFSLQGLNSSASLRWLAIPRSLSMLALSGLALVLIRVFRHNSAWVRRIGWALVGLLLCLLVIDAGLAAVLFWGTLPGVLIGFALPWLIKQRYFGPRRVRVFQSTGIVSPSIQRVAKPAGSALEAPTIISTSPQGMR